jgi:hypothetical protein
MDTETHKPTRNSRWDREPVLDSRGRPKIARITDRDIEIFKLLARYRYLPLDDLHAFVGGSLKGLSHHINVLSRKPNLYVNRPHQQQNSAAANHRRLIYELDDKGTAVLRDRGLPHLAKTHHRNFAHELMAGRVMASFELGARNAGNARLIGWQEILASEKTPARTKGLSQPAQVPVTFTVQGEQRSVNVCADAQPFGIERSGGCRRWYFFFPGIEADCGTEPIESYDLDRTSIYRKFRAYQAIAEQELYASHFGFPNFFVPIITTTDIRMQSMIRLLDKMTDGRGSKMFLFKSFPTSTSIDHMTRAPGHIFADPWHRAGHPPLCFSQP